jgi:prephenate dehydrogenase
VTGTRQATIVGTGLIGGSVGLALRSVGWQVTGIDPDHKRIERALEIGAIDAVGEPGPCDLAVVATPVNALAEMVQVMLDAGAAIVTDVGGVKATVTESVDDPRFVPGHPMAGNEQDGLDGADADLFRGAVWVLTPTENTDDDAFAEVRQILTSLGAQPIVIPPTRHDALVAMVSHVPHLTAATLMRLADDRAVEHRALLRLAAGGFRDMTRIASGHPAIWPDICIENRVAITEVLDELVTELGELRDLVAGGERERVLQVLESARIARRNLPTTAPAPERLTEMRIPVRDEKGEIAAIATLAADLDVNIYDMEIAHSAEGPRGVIIALVDSDLAERFHGGLLALGYRPSLAPLT